MRGDTLEAEVLRVALVLEGVWNELHPSIGKAIVGVVMLGYYVVRRWSHRG